MKVFISYSRDDAPGFVAALRDELARLGHDVWWDEASMSNRGRTFLHEIQSAIDGAAQMVLVWGETAPHKAYVRFEWEHARDAGKVIVPLVIGVRPEALPEELRWCHAVIADASEPTGSFDELSRVLAERPIELASLVGVPGLPPRFRPRHEELDRIRRLVLSDKIAPQAIDGAARCTVLHGMGGVGKSVMAAAFARSPFARLGLEHGIYWLDARGDPSPRELLERLARLVGVPGATPDALREVLQARHVGVIVDDAGRQQVDEVLGVLGRHGRILATTRDASWVAHGGMNLHAVELLSDAESRELLAGWLGEGVEDEPLAAELVRLCGGLPLAIALNAGMLLAGWSWARVIGELQAANLGFAAGKITGYGHESIDRALAVSFLAVADLGHDAQHRLTELVAFLPEEVLPLAAVTRLWRATGGLDAAATEDLIVRLSLRSLLRLEGAEEGRTVALHDLVRAFLESQVPNPMGLNRSLLQAYGPAQELSSVEDDGYVLRSIVRHLLRDGAVATAHHLLTTTSPDGHNAWFARLDEVGLTEFFVADVGRLHRQAVTARDASRNGAETSRLLAREHLYALMTASMVARASRLGPRLLAAVASARLPEWPADRVLAYALTLPREGDRGAAIAEIWGLLPARERDRLYRPVLEWIDVNPFPHSRARAYAAWLRHLDASAVRFIVREVAAQSGEHWRDSDSFMDPRWEVDVAGAVRLAALGATDEAVDMIMTLPEQYHWDSPRRDGLEAIASSLPADACRRVLEIERERSPESRAWSAAIVAGRMAALGHLDEAMALARTVDPVPPSQPPLMDGPDARVQAYRHVLAPERTWERETRLAAEREALALVDTASGAEWGVSAACIAGVLRAHDPASLTRQILDLAPERMSRELYLKQIVPFLPEPARHEALLEWLDDTATQRSVLHGHTLMGYIRWLVPMWSPDHLNELTGLVGGDVCLEDRWEFDLAVAVRQGGAGSGRILRRVVRDRVTIGDIDGRQRATDALRGLATEPVSEAEPVATECRSRLAEIVELESPCERVEKLRGLAPSLGAHWDDVADDVIDLVAGLTPETVRAEAALVVAVALAPGQREALVELAVSSLRADAPQADDERPPVRALAGRPLTGRAEVEALESSTWFLAHVVSTGMHAPTIARRAWQLAGTLDGPEREGIATALLEFARSLGDPHRIDVAALAIRDLPPHARSVAADELRGWARTIDGDPYGRAVAFAAAAVADPPAPRWDDVRAAVALLDGLTPYEQMRVVAWLTRHRSAAAFEEVLDALEGLPRGQAQAEALETAILSSPPGSWDRIMQLIAAIDYPEVELILLHEAITVAPEPVRTQCRSRVATLLRAIDPITAGSRIREHVIALLPVLEPHDAAAALGFLWQSLAGQARSELLEVVARTATDMRLIDEGLTEALAENVELAARWLP